MALITATYFECGVRYERQTEDGMKKVTELYVVDAKTFTEAEARITKNLEPYISGDFDVMTIKRTRYSEYDNSEGQKIYKVKIMFVIVDEKTQKEKRTPIYQLIPANGIEEARRKVDRHFASSAIDYEIATLDESKYFDVFLHDTNADAKD